MLVQKVHRSAFGDRDPETAFANGIQSQRIVDFLKQRFESRSGPRRNRHRACGLMLGVLEDSSGQSRGIGFTGDLIDFIEH